MSAVAGTLDILYEDTMVLVVRKPSGTAVQTKSFGQKDMESLLKNYLAGKGASGYLGIVHRLDQPVEGVMVFAKTPKAAASLSAQAAGTDMEKEYLAVVCGVPKEIKAELKDYLLKDGRTNTSRVVPKGTKGAKEAVLTYEMLGTEAAHSLVRVKLKTGRHHQIRVQMAHAGMPLCGDSKYNPGDGFRQVGLCAYRLTFAHPGSGKRMTFSVRPGNPVFGEFPEALFM